ncbi:hypothetical protein, partial [Klebsiella pneumoniae]
IETDHHQSPAGKPLYSTILQRTLAKQEAEQAAKAQQAPRENT